MHQHHEICLLFSSKWQYVIHEILISRKEIRSENLGFYLQIKVENDDSSKIFCTLYFSRPQKKFVFHKLKIGHGDRVTNNEVLQIVLLHFEKMKCSCLKMSTLSILKQKKVISFQNELDVTHD